MFAAIIGRSLAHHRVVLALAAALLLYGAWTAAHARLDVLPDFAPPQVDIQTEAPGFAPNQVELLVTLPIETALAGVTGLEALRSESIPGLSVVNAVFADGTDVYVARQALAERLADIGPRLPTGVQPPRLSPLTSATMDVLKIGLTSHVQSPMELRTLADWTIRPRLLMIPGIARVNVFGGEVRQLQVRVRPATAHAHGLGLADVVAGARAATALRGAGFVETANQRVVLDALGSAGTVEEVGTTLVGTGVGAPVRLADVATVTEGPAPLFGDALIQGEPGVLLTLSSAYGANTMEVTHALEAALDDLRPLLERDGVTLHPALHRPASFVESALATLRRSLLLGTVLVVLVLLAFLQDARAALVSLTAIPLSLLTAVIILTRCGVTLNTMTLGGLAIAIGEVVDDAIIDVDNIVRRLRLNRQAAQPASPFAVALAASLEVRRAVVFATLAVALVFLPLLGLGGLQGKFFAPLALSYLLAILASLAVALTVTPALALALLGHRDGHDTTPRLQLAATAGYRRVLHWVWRHDRLVLATVTVGAVAGLLLTPWLGGEFLPEFREHHLVVQITTAPGTSMDVMRDLGRKLSRDLLALPGVRTVEQQWGRAEQGEDTWSPNRGELHVELDAEADDEATTMAVRGVLAATAGVESEVLTFLGDRISESISGETAPVVVNVFGEDLDLLDAKAEEIAAVLRATPGAVDVHVDLAASAPHVAIRLRPAALQRRGFRPTEVFETVETAFAGTIAGQVYRGAQPIDVVVSLPPADRADPLTVGDLLVQSAGGALAPLHELADVAVVSARDVIRHEGGRRRQTITSHVEGRDVTAFVADLEARLTREVRLPPGTYRTVGGAAAARTAATRDLLIQATFGVLGVVLLLAIVAEHWRNLAILLLNLPCALAGGVLAVAVTGTGLSLGALVGFVAIFGITLRNAIMMLAHYQHLIGTEGLPWSAATAIHGATDRLLPILMTALVTGLGLLPVALASGEPGGEIDGPMAIVILGGLLTSTTLNLLVLPTLALRYGRFGAADAPSPPIP
jgi:CzcA family heavy metal efflux pump